MFVFISGAVRSGKSEWAEGLLAALPAPRVYLATARVTDGEMRERVARHRAARAGKGFLTLERERDLSGLPIPAGAAVLLESLTSWAANEMFPGDAIGEAAGVKEKICRAVQDLRGRCRHLLVVSDDIFSDGTAYGGATEEYLRLLGGLNAALAAGADAAVECAFGMARAAKLPGGAPDGGRPAEEVALGQLAAGALQESELFRRLHAL